MAANVMKHIVFRVTSLSTQIWQNSIHHRCNVDCSNYYL